jgi:hypothetical protein
MKNSNNLFKQPFQCILINFCVIMYLRMFISKFSWENLIIDKIRSIYLNLHEFTLSYEVKNDKKKLK